VRTRSEQKVRLVLFVGLPCLEISLVVAFYVVPQFQGLNAPIGHWEMETPLRGSPGTSLALIAFLGLLILGNVGLIAVIRQTLNKLKIQNQD
jgi:hypothetical protein